ncbi:MAG TPA: DUF4406 domain-containing protein [bacterium]|nr:DUF4406 domain-containing protein [bacterium]
MENQMKVAYVAGPYRGQSHNDVAQNIAAARAVATQLWSLGYAVVCPHLNSAFMSGVAPEEVFLNGGLEMVRRSDLVVLTPDWAASQGTAAEIEEARTLGIPVFSDIEFVPPADAHPEACANG